VSIIVVEAVAMQDGKMPIGDERGTRVAAAIAFPILRI